MERFNSEESISYSSQPVCNLRDVMLLSSVYLDKPHWLGHWFRSGSIKGMPVNSVKKFAIIINFCAECDTLLFNAPTLASMRTTFIHIPIVNDLDVYDLDCKDTRDWLIRVLHVIANCSDLPILFHCFGGKDRTGVVAASIQFIVGVDRQLVREDYCNSDGKLHRDGFDKFCSSFDTLVIPFIDPSTMMLLRNRFHPPNWTIVSQLRCGYLPRSSRLVTPNGWEWEVDYNGRLLNCAGKLIEQNSDASLIFNHIRAPTSDMALLRSKGYRWIPVIPPCCGGVDSPYNEILINQSALTHYSRAFQECRIIHRTNAHGKGNRQYTIRIENQYFPSMIEGISRPDFIHISLSSNSDTGTANKLNYTVDNRIPDK